MCRLCDYNKNKSTPFFLWFCPMGNNYLSGTFSATAEFYYSRICSVYIAFLNRARK